MTEGFELRTDGFWIKGAYTEMIDWFGDDEPTHNWEYLWKLVFHGLALGVLKNVSHGKVGSKEQVHDLFSPFPIKNTTPNHGLVVAIYTYLRPMNGCV
jgi:glycerol dehydrogenase-like iron-containing ADH family enzyme